LYKLTNPHYNLSDRIIQLRIPANRFHTISQSTIIRSLSLVNLSSKLITSSTTRFYFTLIIESATPGYTSAALYNLSGTLPSQSVALAKQCAAHTMKSVTLSHQGITLSNRSVTLAQQSAEHMIKRVTPVW
jgi:hypothetical protein